MAIADLPVPNTGAVAALPTPETGAPVNGNEVASPTQQGFRSGLKTLGANLNALVGQTGEVLGLSEFANDRFKDAEQYTRDADTPGIKDFGQVKDFTTLTHFVGHLIGEGTASTLPALGLSVGLRRPVAGNIAGFGIPAAGQQVQNLNADPVAKAQGPGAVLRNAAVTGAAQGTILGTVGAPGQVASKLVGQGAKETLGAGVAKAAAGQAIAMPATDVVGQKMHQELNPDKPLDTSHLAEEAITGGVFGGVLGAAGHIPGQLAPAARGIAKSAGELKERFKKPEAPADPEVDMPPKSVDTDARVLQWLNDHEAAGKEYLKSKWEAVKSSGAFENVQDFMKDPGMLREAYNNLKADHYDANIKPVVDGVTQYAKDLAGRLKKKQETKYSMIGEKPDFKEMGQDVLAGNPIHIKSTAPEVSDFMTKNGYKQVQDGIWEPATKHSKMRDKTDTMILQTVAKVLPEDFVAQVPKEKIMEIADLFRKLAENPDEFTETGVPKTLTKLLGGHEVFRDVMKDVQAAVGTDHGPVAKVFKAHEMADQKQLKAVHEIIHAYGRPEHLMHDEHFQVLMDEAAPYLLSKLHEADKMPVLKDGDRPMMRDPKFYDAMHEVFGDNIDKAADALEKLKSKEVTSHEAFDTEDHPAADKRLEQTFNDTPDGAAKLNKLKEQLESEYGRKNVRVSEYEAAPGKIALRLDSAEQAGLDRAAWARVREPEKYNRSGLNNGILTVHMASGTQNKINLMRLTSEMMRGENLSEHAKSGAKYVRDMFNRGMTALMNSEQFKDVKNLRKADGSWDLPGNTPVARMNGQTYTYARLQAAQFDPSKRAGELRRAVREAGGPKARAAAIHDLNDYFREKATDRKYVDSLTEEALTYLHDNGFDEATVNEAKEPIEQALKDARATEGSKRAELYLDAALERIEMEAEKLRKDEPTVDNPESMPVGEEGVRSYEPDTRLPLGKDAPAGPKTGGDPNWSTVFEQPGIKQLREEWKTATPERRDQIRALVAEAEMIAQFSDTPAGNKSQAPAFAEPASKNLRTPLTEAEIAASGDRYARYLKRQKANPLSDTNVAKALTGSADAEGRRMLNSKLVPEQEFQRWLEEKWPDPAKKWEKKYSLMDEKDAANISDREMYERAEAVVLSNWNSADKADIRWGNSTFGGKIRAELAKVGVPEKEIERIMAQHHIPFSTMNVGSGPATPEQVQAVRDYVTKVLGDKVAVKFIEKLGHAGEFAKINGEEMIKISTMAADPLSVGHHEAVHALVSRLLAVDQKAAHTLRRAAEAPAIVARLRTLLKDHPEALKQLADPEERIAYMYQFAAAGHKGLINIGPETKSVFDKIKGVFRKIAAVWADDFATAEAVEKAGDILSAFHNGAFSEKSTVAQVLADRFPRGPYEAAEQMMPWLGRITNKFLWTSTGAVRDMNLPAATGIMDKFHTEIGQGKEPGFVQSKHVAYNQFINQIGDAFKTMPTKERQKIVMDDLRSGKPPETNEGKQIRKVLDDAYQYLQDKGVKLIVKGKDGKLELQDIGKVENYFPRVYDQEVLRTAEGKQKFLEALAPHMTTEAATDVYNNVTKYADSGKPGEEDSALGLTYYTPALQKRMLGLSDAELAPFLSTDLFGTLSQYLQRATRRGEYATRFGNMGEEIATARKQAQKEGMTAEQGKIFDQSVQAMEGTLGADIDPKLKNIYSGLMTYQNIRLLPLQLFSSLIDPLGIVVRGGEMKEAFTAFGKGLRDLAAFKHDDAFELAKTVGAIDTANAHGLMSEMAGSEYMPKIQRAINDKFFRYNGMEKWNNRMRAQAAVAAENFIDKHMNRPTEHSERFMTELGLKKGDDLTVNNPKYVSAVNKWVDEAILRPNAALRPVYMSDPNWMLISHLKQYTYLFQKVIVARVYHELQHNNYTPAMALAAYVPGMVAADMLKMVMTPGSGDDNARAGWTAKDWLGHGMQRAGLFGPSQYGLEAGTDAQRGGIGLESAAGPTVQQFIQTVRGTVQGHGMLQAEKAVPGYSLIKPAGSHGSK